MRRSLSPARCRFARWCLVVPVEAVASFAGGVVGAFNGGVPTRHVIVGTMSPCPVVGEIPVEAVVSPVVPVD